jgi:hypothetical protein
MKGPFPDDGRRLSSSWEGVPMAVAPWIVSDAFWGRFEPLLPKTGRRVRYPGRKRLDDRAAL